MPRPSIFVSRGVGEGAALHTIAFGGPWTLLRLYDDDFAQPLAGTTYELRGRSSGHTVRGESDADGVVYHDRLIEDHYRITVRGVSEDVPLFHDEDRGDVEEPWGLRMRGLSTSAAETESG